MRKSIVIPLFIPLIGFAAVKGFYWYQVKTAVEQIQQQAGPFMTIEYDEIETGLDGAAGIHGVRIYPAGSAVPVAVASVRIISDDWTYFLRQGTPLDKGDLPESLAFEINGIDFELDSPLANQLEQLSAGLNEPVAGCEAGVGEGIDLFRKLGYSSLLSDVGLSYRFSPASEYMTLTMTMGTLASFTMNLSADVDLGITSLSRDNLKGLQPKVGGVTLKYTDDSFNARLIDYCAQQNNEPAEAFVERHVAATAEQYRQLGFIFDGPVIGAYQQFISAGGSATLVLEAADALGMQDAISKTPQQYLDSLAVQLQINGKVVSPLNISWKQPETVAEHSSASAGGLAGLMPQAPAPADSVEPTERAKRPVEAAAEKSGSEAPKQRYLQTRTDQLGAYVGSKAKVWTHNGHLVQGKIIDVLRNRVQLEQRLQSGTAELPVTFNHIAEIRVLR